MENNLFVKLNYRKNGLYAWLIGLIVIVCFTIGLFISFSPQKALYTYWIVMCDIVLTEIMSFMLMMHFYNYSMNKDKQSIPPAMQISTSYAVGLIMTLGIIVDVVFLSSLNSLNIIFFSKIYLWSIIGKWVLAIIISIILLQTVKPTDNVETGDLQNINNERTKILSKIEISQKVLRSITGKDYDKGKINQLIDEVEVIKNRLRTQFKLSSINQLSQLIIFINDYSDKIDSLQTSSKEEVNKNSMEIQSIISKINVELATILKSNRA